MYLLQTIIDTESISQLKSIIDEANKTPLCYYIITAIITLTGTFTGVYYGFKSSKKQDKQKQKDYYKNRLKYLVKINDKVQKNWNEQRQFFYDYSVNMFKNPYDLDSCNQTLHIDNVKKLTDISNEDLYHACLEFINGSDEIKVDSFDDLSDNISVVNRAIFDTIKICIETRQEISTKVEDLNLKLKNLANEVFNKTFIGALAYDKELLDACFNLSDRYNFMSNGGYSIDTIIEHINNFIDITSKYSFKSDFAEVYRSAIEYRNEYYNFKSYIEIYSGAINTSIQINDGSFGIINRIVLQIKEGIA